MDRGADHPVEDALAGAATATRFPKSWRMESRSAALRTIRLPRIATCRLTAAGATLARSA